MKRTHTTSSRSVIHSDSISQLSDPISLLKHAKTGAVAAASLFLLICGWGTARAGGWPTEFAGGLYFYSTDPTPVEVVLDNPDSRRPAHPAVLHVPRAAIIFADNYDPAGLDQLPDKIETSLVILALTYPDGKPLILHAQELAAQKHITLYDAIRALRLQEYKAEIRYTPPDNPWEARERAGRVRFEIKDKYEGMPHAPADYYFGQRGVDEFVRVHCYPEATPTYFCETQMRIAPAVVAAVNFADFRFHGGRAYLNKRARTLRELVCRYVEPSCAPYEKRKR
jgi:hypothetical protein